MILLSTSHGTRFAGDRRMKAEAALTSPPRLSRGRAKALRDNNF